MTQETLETAFMASFADYGDAIFRFCVLKVSNKELAEDMAQEVFMRYWQSLREGKEMSNTRAFLYTIANNLAKDWYKRKKAVSLDDRLDAGFDPVSDEATPERHAMQREAMVGIEDLDQKDQEVLLLRHVEGLGPKEIAEIIGESPNVVSVRINRATARLKDGLGYGT